MRNYEKAKTKTHSRVYRAIQGLKTQSEIAKDFEIHPIMVGKWKNEFLHRIPELFESKNAKKKANGDQDKDNLQRKVGQLTMEVAFLEKSANSWKYT